MIRACLSVLLLAAAPVALAETRALVGATVHAATGSPAIPDAVLIIEGDRIACLGSREACPVPASAEVVDLSGRHVAPGLVDGHVHYGQTGWLDGRPDSGIGTDHYDYEALQASLRDNSDRWHRAWLCSGVTAVYDVGGMPWTLDVAGDEADAPPRPHYRAAGPLITHYEAVFGVLSADGEDTFLPMGSDEAALESVAKLVEMGAQAVKVWYLDPPRGQREALDARLALIGEAAREADLPLIVHATELRNAKAAVRAGASMLVHSVTDRPVDDEFLDLMREHETFYAPTLIVGGNWARAVAAVALGVEPPVTDDPNDCIDTETRRVIAEADTLASGGSSGRVERAFNRLEGVGAERAVTDRNLRRVHRAGIPIVTSTDAGNPLTVHGPSIYAEMAAMESAGLSPGDILTLSTRNGAAAMGRLDDFGTLEAGKLADLVVLEDDPTESTRAWRSIEQVMRAGELLSVEELSAR